MRLLSLTLVVLFGLAANGGGCAPANVVGVQEYGSVVGRVLDATTNQPIPSALVAVGSLFTARADATGGFTISGVPIGAQQVSAHSPGFTTSSVSVTVVKNATVSAGYVRLAPSVGVNATPMPTLPPPATPTPSSSPSPSASPSPSPSP